MGGGGELAFASSLFAPQKHFFPYSIHLASTVEPPKRGTDSLNRWPLK